MTRIEGSGHLGRLLVLITLFGLHATILASNDTVNTSAGYPTDDELRMLPSYCKARLRGVSETEKNQWLSRLGRQNWTGLHHYCAGLNLAKRATLSTNPKARNADLLKSYGIIKSYATDETTEDFILKHEVYYNLGKVALRLDNTGAGVAALNKSIQIKPQFIPAYTALSDYYKSIGDKGEAELILQRGLKIKPDSKSLNRRLTELKGK